MLTREWLRFRAVYLVVTGAVGACYSQVMVQFRAFPFVAVGLLSLLAGGVAAKGQSNPEEEEWRQLFNGENLDGWDVKIAGRDLHDNYLRTFRVEDQTLKVVYDEYDRFEGEFGHLFYKEKFSYYRLRFQYRFNGEQTLGAPDWALRNSGVMVHSQCAPSMGRDQDFPISIEVQLLGGTGQGERSTANLCTPGTHVEIEGRLVTDHCLNSTSKTYHGDQWVEAEVEVLGNESVRHFVEGQLVMAYQKPQIGGGVVSGFDPAVKEDGKLLAEGCIALQAESHPVEFRKIELLSLAGCTDPTASNYKSYFVKSVNSECRY